MYYDDEDEIMDVKKSMQRRYGMHKFLPLKRLEKSLK
jgi:hypothetical protein